MKGVGKEVLTKECLSTFYVLLNHIQQLILAENVPALQITLEVIADCYGLPTFAYLLMTESVKAAVKLTSTYPPHRTNRYLKSDYKHINPSFCGAR